MNEDQVYYALVKFYQNILRKELATKDDLNDLVGKVDSLTTKVNGLTTKVNGLTTKVKGLATKGDIDQLDKRVDLLAEKITDSRMECDCRLKRVEKDLGFV